MSRITIHEAKTQLSELIRRAEAGEEVVISRGDKPVAVLKGYDRDEVRKKRLAGMGSLVGKMPPVPDSALFDPLSDEELALWYDGPVFPCGS